MVGTVGTKKLDFGLFPPVPTGFIAWWEQANPIMARPRGRCSHCSHLFPPFFHIYRALLIKSIVG